MKKILFWLACALTSNAVLAWDGSESGKINAIEVTSGNNYAFRIWLSGSDGMCGNSHKWAYLNESDSNYSVYISTLLMAKAAQQTVRVYTNRKNGESTGYCHIGHVQIN